MRLGMIGQGRIAANLTVRLGQGGHELIVYDQGPEAVASAGEAGALLVGSLRDLCAMLAPPRVIWLMLPDRKPTADTLSALLELLAPEDIVIDSGSSPFRVTMERGLAASLRGIFLVDVGISGGLLGRDSGYCLMVGGEEEAVSRVLPVFTTAAAPGGYAHVGPSGAGHFAKMVHNGIEYGMLAAYAEGFAILESSDFSFALPHLAKLWLSGSIIRSWLLELAEQVLRRDPKLAEVAGYVEDSGEGRWAVQTAIDENVPAPVTTLALLSRLASRQDESFSAKVIAALRHEYGGHSIMSPAAGRSLGPDVPAGNRGGGPSS